MDKSKFRRKYFLGLLTSCWTLLPLVGGATGLAILAAMDRSVPYAWLACGGSILFGVGVFFQRLILGSESVAKEAQQEVQREEEEAASEARRREEEALNELDERLAHDRNPEAMEALRELRDLQNEFRNFQYRSSITAQLLETAEAMLKQCIGSLEETLTLSAKARSAESSAKRRQALTEREAHLKSVQESIEKLNQALAELKKLSAGREENHRAELTRQGEELSEQLRIARNVDERMRSLGFEGRKSGESREEP